MIEKYCRKVLTSFWQQSNFIGNIKRLLVLEEISESVAFFLDNRLLSVYVVFMNAIKEDA